MTELDAVPEVGSHHGRYVFLREIAQGPLGPMYELRGERDAGGLSGMGRVIQLASDFDPGAEQAVASAAWDSLELRHERALAVADVAFGSGWVTLVHDYQEGSMLRSLRRRAQERNSTFPVAIALRIALDFIEGLLNHRRACESAGITWTPGGIGTGSLYLCGDGQIRLLDGQVMFTLIRAKNRRKGGNFPCFAPEVLDANETVDERADVFAVGVVLWELLTGFELGEAMGSQPDPSVRHAPKLAQRVAANSSKLSPDLIRAVDAALETKPVRRPATLASLKAVLSRNSDIATYTQVIDFTDALLNRESTLFRLTLDPVPKLSDELRGVKNLTPHQEWTLELAKRARLPGTSGPTDVPRPHVANVKSAPRDVIAKRTTPAFVPPKPQANVAHRTLIGISPGGASSLEANRGSVAARIAVPQVSVPPVIQPEPTSEVLHVASEPEAQLESDSSVRPKAPEEPSSLARAPDAAEADGLKPPDTMDIQELISNSVTLELALKPAIRNADTLELPPDRINVTGASEKEPVNVVKLTRLAIAAWLSVAVGVTVIATLLVQKLSTRDLPVGVRAGTLATQRAFDTSVTRAAVATAVELAARESILVVPPTTPAVASAETPTTPVTMAPSATPAAPAKPTSTEVRGPGTRSTGTSKPAAQKKKHAYVPRGL